MNSHEPPSNVRRLVILSAMLMAILLYLDRFCVSLAADYIREDLDLSQKQISWFLGAFFWSYALAQVPSGWLSDRYGARIMLAIYILSWSLFTAMIGAVYSFAMLMTARLACGLGQAGAYPTSASMVSKWVPFSERGAASAVISFGGRVGGALAPLLTAYLIVLFVPMETSPLLRPAELRGPAQFAAKITPVSESESSALPADKQKKLVKPSPASLVIRALFSEDVQERAKRIAKAYRQRQIESLLAEEPMGEVKVDDGDRTALVEGINQLIQSGGFYDGEAFNDPSLKFVREALDFLKRQREGESLSPAEQARLNRFLIEGVFPSEVGKLYTNGWRPVMFIYGAVGIAVAFLFWIVVRDRPEAHPSCNRAEQMLIASGRPVGSPSPHGKAGNVPWIPLLKSRSMWLCCVMQVGTNIGWVFLVTWLPRYLVDVHQVPILERGLMTSVPLVVGIVGMLAGGRLTDWMVLKFGVRWGRGLPMMLTRFSAALGYVIVFGLAMLPDGSPLKTPWMFIAAFSLVAFSTDLGTASIWAFNQDVGGRYVGSILGWGNMWGNLGAGISPPLIYDYFLGETPLVSDWNTMFLVCAGAFVVSGLCGLGVDASIPIAPPDEEDSDRDET